MASASAGSLDERKEHSHSQSLSRHSPPEGGAFALGTPALGGRRGDSPSVSASASGANLVRALQASGAPAGSGGGGGGGGGGSGGPSRNSSFAPSPLLTATQQQQQQSAPLRSPRLSSLALPFMLSSASAASLSEAVAAAGAGAGSGGAPSPSPRGRVSPSSSAAVLGTPMQRPVPRVDSDDALYSQAVAWEVDADEIDFSRSAKIGQGSHGEVFRAKWRGTPIAVKQLATSGAGAAALGEMRHEIAVLAHMHHPRVVQFLGACTKGRPLLVLSEYLRGGSVAQALEKQRGERLPLAIAGRWALDTAQGLRYLHEHKPMPVVHRDLKPQNLLIDGSGHVKISDFGLAKVVDQLKAMDEHYVMTGETGSYRYMAPEVFRHERYTEKVDVYALGVVLFQLTSPTGEPPLAWLGAVAAAEAMSLRHERPEISPKLPPRLRALIDLCWHPDPARRPSAAHCCSEIEAIFPQDADDGGPDGASQGLMSAEAALAVERTAGFGGAADKRGVRGADGKCALV